MTPAALVGRPAELSRLDELIKGVSAVGACLVVSGEPGAGKSALLGEAFPPPPPRNSGRVLARAALA
jgi:alpha-D-ribose 1-methylphosphonate 5-triphosphate synthase subunit PhnL